MHNNPWPPDRGGDSPDPHRDPYAQFQPAPRPSEQEAEVVGVNTGYGTALGASAIWFAVSFVLEVATRGALRASGEPVGQAGHVGALLLALGGVSSLVIWLIVRDRKQGPPFWHLVLMALGFYSIYFIPALISFFAALSTAA